jgi:hypothetical protein
MFSFLRKKSFTKRAALMGAVLVLLTGFLFVSCEQPGGVEKDGDATLKSLAVSAGTLSPAFNSSRYDYSVTVRNAVDLITVSATPNSIKTMVSGTGEKALTEGANTVPIMVKAENGDSMTYTITVKRLDSSVIAIETAQDMAKIGVEDKWTLASSYVLMNDITLENSNPVGDTTLPFSGEFDGDGKTITLKSLGNPAGNSSIIPVPQTTINASPTNYNNAFLGIFGFVKGATAAKAVIKNLKIVSSVDAVSNSDNGLAVGLVVGYAEQAVIENITLSGTFSFYSASGKTAYAGGVAGIIVGDGAVVKDCTSSMAMNIKPGYDNPLVAGLPNPFSWAGGFVGYFMLGGGIENCHNTGAVSAISEKSGSQVMVGGIAGGSFYGFSTQYHGYIQDSSSTGKITVGAKGFWPFAGGIAGTVCGGMGKRENTTRIERCYATGIIENASAGSAAQWPYIGGITGYVYCGAWVSQCYFIGTVINEKQNDYTGGIAGYSSFATNYKDEDNNPCLIEDCWSSGEIRGFNNGGGIVGQNQQNTLLKRSYSLMKISVINGGTSSAAQWGIGGIVGSHSSTRIADAMEACVALNPSIYAPKAGKFANGNLPPNGIGEIHRIAGRAQVADGVYPIMTNVYALPNLIPKVDDPTTPYVADKGTSRPDGADIPAQYLNGNKPTQVFYQNVLKWDFTNVWKMGSDGYPKLKWQ